MDWHSPLDPLDDASGVVSSEGDEEVDSEGSAVGAAVVGAALWGAALLAGADGGAAVGAASWHAVSTRVASTAGTTATVLDRTIFMMASLPC
ncbi:hypothetical protein [Demetria terragena]|uniref:hypothetical protein n=1 Tax=Demetria terragena TaxID=63959 RepID=UPI00039B8768|nr:hypothetical protein [Demetria terragena]